MVLKKSISFSGFEYVRTQYRDIIISYFISPRVNLCTMGSTSIPMAPLSPSVKKAVPRAVADLNVHNVVLGDVQFKTWYPSFYPEELVGRGLEKLYVCQWCFKYSEELEKFLAHQVELWGLRGGERALITLFADNLTRDCAARASR